MRRLLALILVLLIAYAVGVYGGDDQHALHSTGLALGFALIAAALAGALLERLRLPRITGYLLFGMFCGPYLANIITRPMARELQLFNGLAIALIAFIAGLEMNFERLRPRLARILQLGTVVILTMFAGLFLLFWVAWPWLPIAPGATGVARVGLVAILTIVTVSFSPTVTIAVIAESRARGPLSETVMAVVVLGDIALILLFTLGMQFVRWTTDNAVGPADVGLAIRLAWEIFGSFAFGAVVGALFAFYMRFVGRELTLVLLALCVLLSEVGSRLQFEPLLAALAAGLVVENIAPPRGDALKEAVERGALPVLIIFFAAAGASLQLDALATLGLVALIVSVARLGLIRAGTELGIRASGMDPATGNLVWTGLVSQAGVTLGLAILVASEFPTWGIGLQTLMVALIAIHELIGPVLFRAGLVRAGEVGRMGVHDHAGPVVPVRR